MIHANNKNIALNSYHVKRYFCVTHTAMGPNSFMLQCKKIILDNVSKVWYSTLIIMQLAAWWCTTFLPYLAPDPQPIGGLFL